MREIAKIGLLKMWREVAKKKEIIQLASISPTLLVLNNDVNGKISISTVVFCGRKKYVYGLISKWILGQVASTKNFEGPRLQNFNVMLRPQGR